MNRGELRALVLQNTKRSDKTDLINSALDLAVDEVSSSNLWMDLLTEGEVTLTTGASSVDLVLNTARVVEVRLVDGFNSYPLQIRPKSWLVKYYPVPDIRAVAKPVYGYLNGSSLFTIPRPQKDYTIRYTYYPLHGPFSGDADVLRIRHAVKPVVAYATHWVFFSLEKYQDAQAWLSLYASALESAKKLDGGDSAIQFKGDIRGYPPSPSPTSEYWNDPFVFRVP